MKKLICEVVEVKDKCPIYKVGDRIVIKDSEIDLEETDRICVHALVPILHYSIALRENVSPKKLGLCSKGKYAYIHCIDPGKPYTEGGSVIFKVWKE